MERFAAQRREINPVNVEHVSPELAATLAGRIRHRILHADDTLRFDQTAAVAFLRAWEEVSPRKTRRRFFTEAANGAGPDYLSTAASPWGGLSPAQIERLREIHAELGAFMSGALATGNAFPGKAYADDEARRLGFIIAWDRPENRGALVQCLRAAVGAWLDRSRRDKGEVIDTPSQPATLAPQSPEKPATTAGEHTPREAFESWRDADPDRPPKTVEAFDSAVRRLEALFPGRSVESLTRADGVAFEAALKRWADDEKKSRTTAANILTKVKTVLNHAHDLEWIARNPLERRSIERAESERVPFSDADLSKLFASPIFTHYALPSVARAGKDAAYWLPLLGLFTGARISELAQLWTDDVTNTEAAGWVIAFRSNKDRGQSIKSRSGVRDVPVHPELIRLGFADYVQAVAATGTGPLFPAVPPSQKNGAGGEVSKWFGQFKTAQGFGPDQTFHSFRHTLETRLQALGIAESHIDAIVGHAAKGEGRKTYTHLDPEHLRPTLERLAFSRLSLPKVFKAPAWTPGNPRASRGRR
jgi:integrase